MTQGAAGLISWAALEQRPKPHLAEGGGGARGQRLREGDRAAYSRNCRHVKYLCGVERWVGRRPGHWSSGLQGPALTRILLGGVGMGGSKNSLGGHRWPLSTFCLWWEAFPSQGPHTDAPGWLGGSQAPSRLCGHLSHRAHHVESFHAGPALRIGDPRDSPTLGWGGCCFHLP